MNPFQPGGFHPIGAFCGPECSCDSHCVCKRPLFPFHACPHLPPFPIMPCGPECGCDSHCECKKHLHPVHKCPHEPNHHRENHCSHECGCHFRCQHKARWCRHEARHPCKCPPHRCFHMQEMLRECVKNCNSPQNQVSINFYGDTRHIRSGQPDTGCKHRACRESSLDDLPEAFLSSSSSDSRRLSDVLEEESRSRSDERPSSDSSTSESSAPNQPVYPRHHAHEDADRDLPFHTSTYDDIEDGIPGWTKTLKRDQGEDADKEEKRSRHLRREEWRKEENKKKVPLLENYYEKDDRKKKKKNKKEKRRMHRSDKKALKSRKGPLHAEPAIETQATDMDPRIVGASQKSRSRHHRDGDRGSAGKRVVIMRSKHGKRGSAPLS